MRLFSLSAIITHMISTIVLMLIYISFISLGLPDSLLGASWPIMHTELGAELSMLGLITMIVSAGTIVSSVSYAKVCRRTDAGKLNAFSTLLTCVCLFTLSHMQNFYAMFPVALLLGIGGGAIDAALNNYVSLNYKARQLSFLHACWGIGTIFGPTILSFLFRAGKSWRGAYTTVATAQACIFALLLFTLPLWKKAEKKHIEIKEEEEKHVSIKKVMKIRGAKLSLFSTFLYCAIEATTLIWTASFMTTSRGFDSSGAALIVSMLYWGITIGRIVTGFVNDRMGDDKVTIIGLVITLVAAFFFLTMKSFSPIMASAFFIGFGFGPVYPSILHQTPEHFGLENSGPVMGLQMASAYVGSSFMPFLFGLGTKILTPSYLPWMLLIFTLLQIWAWKKRKDTFC